MPMPVSGKQVGAELNTELLDVGKTQLAVVQWIVDVVARVDSHPCSIVLVTTQ